MGLVTRTHLYPYHLQSSAKVRTYARHGTPRVSVRVSVCACVRVRIRIRMHVCMHMCVCVCVCVCVCICMHAHARASVRVCVRCACCTCACVLMSACYWRTAPEKYTCKNPHTLIHEQDALVRLMCV